MSPVEIPRSSGRTVRVRFTENVSYGGVDYGPSYQAKEAEVRIDWARYFVRSGKAEYVTADEPADETEPKTDGAEAGGEAEGGPDSGDGAEDDGSEDDDEEEEGDEDLALPEDLPGVAALRAVGVTTWDELAEVPDLTQIPGIGTSTAKSIAKVQAERAGD